MADDDLGAAGAAGADKGAAAAGADKGAAAGDKGASGTIAGGAAGAGDVGAAQGAAAGAGAANGTAPAFAWPDGWRDQMAESIKPGDKGFRQRLERFSAPTDVGKSWLSYEQRVSSGEYKRDLPANATPEQMAEWRKERGVPESWEKYEAPKLANGVVLSEADKPVVDLFTKFAHTKNMTTAQRDEVLGWYYDTQDVLKSERDDADASFKTTAEDALRADWGQDFRPNLNAVGNFITGYFPDDLGAILLAGRTYDGKKIGDDPRIMKVLARVARELDPAATLVNPAGGTPGASVDSRLEEIRKIARENPDGYDADHKLQKERLELTEIKQRQQARGTRAA